MRLDGETEDNINKKVIRLIQGEKIGIKEDLDATKRELTIERKNKDAAISQAQNAQTILEDEWKDKSKTKTNKKIKRLWLYSAGFPIIILAAILSFDKFDIWINSIPELYGSLVLDALVSIALFFWRFYPKIKYLKNHREEIAEDYVKEQRQKYSSKLSTT